MYVVGLEEMVDLTATTVVLEAQSQKRAGVWLEMVSNALNRGAKNDVFSFPSFHSRNPPTCLSSTRFWWVFSYVCSSANPSVSVCKMWWVCFHAFSDVQRQRLLRVFSVWWVTKVVLPSVSSWWTAHFALCVLTLLLIVRMWLDVTLISTSKPLI